METVVIGGLCVLVVVAYEKKGDLSAILPTFSLFAFGLMRIMQRMSPLYTYGMELAHYLPSVNIVVDLIRHKADVRRGGKKFTGLKKGIEFRNVSFSYPNVPHNKVLDSVTFKIESSQFIAIVGPSGSGKSTVADLILGLYSPSEGSIVIDDSEPLSCFEISSWRSRIGFVGQETILFNGSIKENIAFADSNIDIGRVKEAAKLANAHGFILKLPNGYDTEIGERGQKLSGGERQRLAIARALYRNPEIIILDEATSSLDTKAEKEVQKAIENLGGRKTLIVIAHRLSTITKADRIYVLWDGRIIEEGTHYELIEKEGAYLELSKKQHLSMNVK
jgi:subfamily B ATP-binding cassette protein MsbA